MGKVRMRPLRDQVIVLTEATTGIGRAIAHLATERGAKVVLCSQNDDELRALTEDIRQRGGEVSFAVLDVTRADDTRRLVDRALDAYGRIDTWVNSSSRFLTGYLLDTKIEEEKNLFGANFWSTRLGSQAAVAAMKKSGGTIINLGLEASVATGPLFGAYAATKAAIREFTEALRSELRDRQIPVELCLVHPPALDVPEANYSPEMTADAILRVAETPERDVYVGGPAKFAAIIDTFFPELKDLFIDARFKDMKEKPLAIEGPREGSALNIVKTITQTARRTLGGSRRKGQEE